MVCKKCNNTGRTKENPMECNSCGRKFVQQISNSNREDFLKYINDFELASQWSSSYIEDRLISYGIPTSNDLKNKLVFLETIIEQVKLNETKNSSFVLSIQPELYEILTYWAYKLLLTLDDNNISTLDNIYNVSLITDLDSIGDDNRLLVDLVIIIECNLLSQKNSSILQDVISIRKRKGFTTFIITKEPIKKFIVNGFDSIYSLKLNSINNNLFKPYPFTLATYV